MTSTCLDVEDQNGFRGGREKTTEGDETQSIEEVLLPVVKLKQRHLSFTNLMKCRCLPEDDIVSGWVWCHAVLYILVYVSLTVQSLNHFGIQKILVPKVSLFQYTA